MNQPSMYIPNTVAPETFSLNAYMPVPGFGVLPVNAFVIRAAQPVLVDTGLAALADQFITDLETVIDPRDLRWIWITHTDADHTGNLNRVLELAPNARLVTTFMGKAKLAMQGFPVERAYLLNPGQSLHVGDRTLQALTPPTFDAPETTALFDEKTRTLFSADCFGALLDAPAETANSIAPDKLGEGMIAWTNFDTPWLHTVDEQRFEQQLDTIQQLGVERVLSSHLPPANDMTGTLLSYLAHARTAPAFNGPCQAEMERMMSAA